MMSVVDETDPNFPYQMVLMYLSNGCSFSQVVQDLSCLLVPNFTTIIIGDLNFDKKDKNDLTSFLSKKKFSQQVSWPTHIQGRTLDHCYVSKNIHVKGETMDFNLSMYVRVLGETRKRIIRLI